MPIIKELHRIRLHEGTVIAQDEVLDAQRRLGREIWVKYHGELTIRRTIFREWKYIFWTEVDKN